MRAVRLLAYDGLPQSLAVVELPVPRPRAGEVLVRMHAAPINPSDLAFIRGRYGFKKALPAIPGFEGSGTVVAIGPGVLPSIMRGRRVACALAEPGHASGTWAEYAAAPARRCAPLRRSVDLEQAAMMFVNPLMAWVLVSEARSKRHPAVVQNAAASALGKMVLCLARQCSLPVINIVRRPEQLTLLRTLGADHVLHSSEPSFDRELRRLCHELGATIAFDAVTGEMSGRMLQAMPMGSRLLVYGSLSESAVQLDPRSLIFEEKSVSGLWLSRWMGKRNPFAQLSVIGKVQSLLSTDLKSDIQARFRLDDVARALEYYTSNMSAGKVLLVPQV